MPQERLAKMPRYDRYESLRVQISGAVKRGDVSVVWADDTTCFFRKDGKTYKLDATKGKAVETDEPMPSRTGPRAANRRNPERGRQFDTIYTADDKTKAFFRDRNVFVANADGTGETPVTTLGSVEKRLKFGVASWVYGEELNVREAMWFSPDGKKLAYYGFDESGVQDYFLAMQVTRIQNALDVEPYPKAGATNPKVSLWLYDLGSKASVQVDTGPADGVGHYVYDVRWSPSGKELLYNRTNRKQNIMDFCAADPATGKSRVVVHEEWPASWTENSPQITWLADQQRFIWVSEKTGFRNFYLGNLDGSPLRPITQHGFEVGTIVKIDEPRKQLWYMARDGDNPYRAQLHRIGLDGRAGTRLTDPKFHHAVAVSPGGRFFSDVAETMTEPPVTRICDQSGKVVSTIADSDVTKFKELKLQLAEPIIFKAADGTTDCYGYLQKPSDFDPIKKYPLVVEVYGGPESGRGSDRFLTPNPVTELGFLVAWFDGRGTSGRGKAFKDALYGKMGVVEIDDQAAGVRELAKRPYVDASRVGITGTSYGGYASVMAILRHPDVFQAAVASSAVTAWGNYDTIYTERYMGLPWESENKVGYDAGSAMTYAKSLRGDLMLFYGTADNNVHPANSYQLAQALTRAGKSFDMLAGPDQGHSGIPFYREWEYFIEKLILKK